ncbi:formate/nitrite transporter family protein [Sphingomonas sp. ASV193]|uniref:formate/nitrite transporter family protein n=1 Tax=Sphingomonas sp. ASV193 TaxID=3144405 RepID=UPI0032E89C14
MRKAPRSSAESKVSAGKSDALTKDERHEVEARKSPPAKVVHEVIRLQGVEELERPLASLIWSGIAGGVSIWMSLIAQSALMMKLPDTPWRPAIAALGYSVGFLVVILGKLQLFTESTVTAVLPTATEPTARNLGLTLRLWATVFLANSIGTLLVAAIIPFAGLVSPEQVAAMVDISRHLEAHGALDAFTLGIPAGFILATIAWVLPNARGQEFWIIILMTSLIALCGFSHVIAGSAEAWLLMTTGERGLGFVIFTFTLPTLAGNIVGGTGLFAVLAHAQVSKEL